MGRPLWQIFLALFVVAFVVQRAVVASVVHLEGSAPALLAGYAFQIAAGLVAAVGIWLSRSWVPGAVLALGTGVAATAFLEVLLGVRPAFTAASQIVVAALSTGALFLVLRREFGSA